MLSHQRVCVRRVLPIFSLFAAANTLFGQFRGAIQGTVKDASGAVLPAAKVILTNNETRRKQQTVSSNEGFYHFSGLAPGTYNLEASAPGMKVRLVQNVPLAAESTLGVDLTLDPGAITETV